MFDSTLPTSKNRVNAHGTMVRCIAMIQGNRVYEFHYQKVNGEWVRFRRDTHTVH